MARDRSEAAILVIGAVALGAYLGLAWTGLEWSWLARLQARDDYKVASGLVLAAYLAFQWSATTRRHAHPRRVWFRHKLAGALAPLVLYLHAARFGYGYLLLLALLYLGTAAIGLLNRPVLRARAAWLFTLWFIIHVITSVLLVILASYHVVIALAYE